MSLSSLPLEEIPLYSLKIVNIFLISLQHTTEKDEKLSIHSNQNLPKSTLYIILTLINTLGGKRIQIIQRDDC